MAKECIQKWKHQRFEGLHVNSGHVNDYHGCSKTKNPQNSWPPRSLSYLATSLGLRSASAKIKRASFNRKSSQPCKTSTENGDIKKNSSLQGVQTKTKTHNWSCLCLEQSGFHASTGIERKQLYIFEEKAQHFRNTLLETNIAPENGCLEY